jgi:hypothetical protein
MKKTKNIFKHTINKISACKLGASSFQCFKNPGFCGMDSMSEDTIQSFLDKSIYLEEDMIVIFELSIKITNKKLIISTRDSSFVIDLNNIKNIELTSEEHNYILNVSEINFNHKIKYPKNYYIIKNFNLLLKDIPYKLIINKALIHITENFILQEEKLCI